MGRVPRGLDHIYTMTINTKPRDIKHISFEQAVKFKKHLNYITEELLNFLPEAHDVFRYTRRMEIPLEDEKDISTFKKFESDLWDSWKVLADTKSYVTLRESIERHKKIKIPPTREIIETKFLYEKVAGVNPYVFIITYFTDWKRKPADEINP